MATSNSSCTYFNWLLQVEKKRWFLSHLLFPNGAERLGGYGSSITREAQQHPDRKARSHF